MNLFFKNLDNNKKNSFESKPNNLKRQPEHLQVPADSLINGEQDVLYDSKLEKKLKTEDSINLKSTKKKLNKFR